MKGNERKGKERKEKERKFVVTTMSEDMETDDSVEETAAPS